MKKRAMKKVMKRPKRRRVTGLGKDSVSDLCPAYVTTGGDFVSDLCPADVTTGIGARARVIKVARDGRLRAKKALLIDAKKR